MIKLLDLLKEAKGKPKAIFMAGPAGSGQTFVSAQLIPKNLTVINVDDTYEELLKAAGLGMKIADFNQDQLSQAGKLMGQAQKATKEKYAELSGAKKDIIIDGTGAASKPLLKKKAELEALGYETAMIMTYVSPITSLERNKQRDRSLLPSIVIRSWRDVNTNIDTYKQTFGNNFTLVNLDPEDANKDFDEEFIYKTYIEPLGQVGKEKSSEEKAKSKAEAEKIYSDIKQTLKSQPKFDTIEQAKTKITNFINK
jgi:predicted kinase